MSTQEIRLDAAPPYRFAASLDFVCSFPATGGEQITTGTSLTKAFRAEGVTVAAMLSDGGSKDEPAVACRLTAAEPLTEPVVAATRDRLSFFLSLDDDLTSFYRAARADPPFAAVARRMHGYHQVKFPTPLEHLCWAILAQRTPMPAARKAKQALVDHFGNRVETDAGPLWAFPDLGQFLTLSESALATLVGNERKARYLHGTIHTYARTDEAFLRCGPYDEVKDFLLSLPGIGPWSASFVLIRGLGRMEKMPADPAGLKAAAKVYGRSLSEAEFTELAAHYGDQQGYWGHYLRAGS
ncbi:DNA-3-methyladenine glycosylase family protein [Streptomyces flavofungini]|uniref:DNA-3-methyladenine glycosylase II n=1 Tax=Streptomyces flavofungini TaxID=68200 RepID=A0ABS0XGP8_9ACTN|nr:DNA-3-methyladenine glycosylase 2 family protein [Streptomyces flavofungini]MBJ3812385.1 DNA-3-methyladenine glycosylase 2 family protein [Streptomyces flavofungini]GHC88063.1 DNA-3-methyladenine glycosylase 2 family protein [Streptomyces flavofungini]